MPVCVSILKCVLNNIMIFLKFWPYVEEIPKACINIFQFSSELNLYTTACPIWISSTTSFSLNKIYDKFWNMLKYALGSRYIRPWHSTLSNTDKNIRMCKNLKKVFFFFWIIFNHTFYYLFGRYEKELVGKFRSDFSLEKIFCYFKFEKNRRFVSIS